MKYASNLVATLAALGLVTLSASFPVALQAAGQSSAIESRFAVVDGVRLHYLTAGKGSPLILLHGYAETSRMWRPLMPRLAERFLVIAPDLPGIGVLQDTGHWMLEEQPAATSDALVRFLSAPGR